MKNIVFVIFFCLLLSCYNDKPIVCYGPIMVESNPAADGFRFSESDSLAINLADSVMVAMGGRKNWDETRYLKWNFFGSRRHIWDKWNNALIIEGLKDSFYIEMNLDSITGRVNLLGKELKETDSLDLYLKKGKEMWINDSYWVFLPFKLKDSGVSLKYLGKDTTAQGEKTEVLELRFKSVGVTPNNKYHVHINPENFMISQWDFYSEASDTIPRFKTPWKSYKLHDRILLSSSRGENYTISELSASDTLANYFNVQ